MSNTKQTTTDPYRRMGTIIAVTTVAVFTIFWLATMVEPEIRYAAIAIVMIAISVGISVLPTVVSRRRRHRQSNAITAANLVAIVLMLPGFCLWPLGILGLVVWLVALIWSCTADVMPPVIQPSQADEGPGRFRILGVDRESGLDTELVVEAQSQANARAKAELQGVVVTGITREAVLERQRAQ